MRSETEEDYEDGTAISGIESILDICMTYFKKRRLRWHYRSEHESLINFSNSEFYDGDLMIFPSPKGNHKDYGINHHYINNATYKNGRNYKEAEFVVNNIIEHYQKYPELTLGIATFNIRQRDLITDLLENVFKKEPWLDKKIKETENTFEPFFIKNLENVQGDERDIIFISTTFGKDPDSGKVYQRFGPLGGDLGWRRLNVICTRAKKRIELFTSLRPGDIVFDEKGNKGKQALKSYLDYAENDGRLKEFGIESNREPDSDFEISVGREIQKYGYEVMPQLGVAGFFIDLAIKHPYLTGEYLLGIECDGATYHSSKSVRDRDLIRQEILESKGWIIYRVWSTDWFKNRDKEIKRLISFIEELLEKNKQVFEEIKVSEDLERVDNYSDKDVISGVIDKEQEVINESLENILLSYKYSNIDPRFPNQEKGILRDEMLNLFVKCKPTSFKEFQTSFPQALREITDNNQGQFLEDIFELIEEYSNATCT
jgi:very-short-patch-repair endonuclease